MTSKKLKNLRKEILDKYSGKLTGYKHLDDGTDAYARSIPNESEENSEEKSEKTWHSCQELL